MDKKCYNVGIDLGTTNSVFTVYNEQYSRPDVLKIYGKTGITPSVIYYDNEYDKFIIGDEAKEQADYYANSFAFMKIKMTEGDEETDEHNGLKMSPISFSSKLLKYMYDGFKEHYGEDAEIQNLVITVPAYFKDKERKCTLEAAKQSGMKVNGEIRLINEPTSAALAYGDQLAKAKTIITYDLGGGTFDVTLLEIDEIEGVKIFQAKKTDGKTLGGYNFDELIINKLYDCLKSKQETEETKEEINLIKNSLKAEAEKIKISLSKLDKVKGTCIAFGLNQKYLIDYEITKEEFEKMIEPSIDDTIKMTKKIAGKNTINDFVLVGGSTRIPLIEKKIKEAFPNIDIVKVDPDLIVGLGAAIQAGIMDNKRNSVLNEILSGGSIGISVAGDFVTYLVKEGTPIPFSISERFSTIQQGTDHVETYVVQGKDINLESPNNLVLGKIILEDLVVSQQSSIIDIKINVNKSGEVEIIANEAAKGGATVVKLFKIGGPTEKADRMKINSEAVFRDKTSDDILDTADKMLEMLEDPKIVGMDPQIRNWLADEIDKAIVAEDIERLKELLIRLLLVVKQ